MSQLSVDFAVAAYREDGAWKVVQLPRQAGTDIKELIKALRPCPSDTGALGFVAIDEDFFVIARVDGSDVRVLLSDATAVDEWPIASSIADLLDLPDPDDDDEPQPAGDMDIIADLGMTAIDLAVLCDDDELYPDEMLSDIAEQLGFGDEFDTAIEMVSA